jgi:hypothetical protein
MTQRCSTCGLHKPREAFYKRKDRPLGLTSSCKECKSSKRKEEWIPRKQSSYKLMSQYGMTTEDYQKLFNKQNGVCAICNKRESAKSNGGYIKSLAVDHCHTTGKIRGLLCQDCNLGIGKLKDDVALVEAALNYLKEKL